MHMDGWRTQWRILCGLNNKILMMMPVEAGPCIVIEIVCNYFNGSGGKLIACIAMESIWDLGYMAGGSEL